MSNEGTIIMIIYTLSLPGSTAEQVVFVGDSAGGNFVIAAAMKLAQLGLRLPDSIVSCYPATNLTSSISPSRFLSLMDILLPIGVLISCQQVYIITGSISPSLLLYLKLMLVVALLGCEPVGGSMYMYIALHLPSFPT